MVEDIFDIVDENDNVVSRAPRAEAHAKRLMHRASHVLMFRNGGREILLQKRSATKDSYPLAYTTSCSGHVDSGEDYDTAVVREMREETGLEVDISSLEKIGKVCPSEETGWEFTAVYKFDCKGDEILIAQPSEVEAFEWVSVDDFEIAYRKNPENFTPSFLKVYEFWKSKTSSK